MTQTVTADGAVIADTEFNAAPAVQPVFVEGQARQLVQLLNVSYVNKTTNFPEAAILDTARYRALLIIVEWVSGTGTNPMLFVDLVAVLPSGAHYDYYNNGGHNGSFRMDVGAGLAPNQIVPALFTLTYSITGTTPSITFNVTVWGEV